MAGESDEKQAGENGLPSKKVAWKKKTFPPSTSLPPTKTFFSSSQLEPESKRCAFVFSSFHAHSGGGLCGLRRPAKRHPQGTGARVRFVAAFAKETERAKGCICRGALFLLAVEWFFFFFPSERFPLRRSAFDFGNQLLKAAPTRNRAAPGMRICVLKCRERAPVEPFFPPLVFIGAFFPLSLSLSFSAATRTTCFSDAIKPNGETKTPSRVVFRTRFSQTENADHLRCLIVGC